MWTRIRALVHKEFLAVWRDKRSRLVLIVPPIIQLLVFTWAATLDVRNADIGVVNRDNGQRSFELIQRFHGSPFFSKITSLDQQEIKDYIDDRRGLMVMMLDDQFSRNLNAGKPADVLLILDGRRSNTTQIVAGYAANIVEQFNHDYASRAQLQELNTGLVIRHWFNPNLLYYWYNVPSLSAILPMLVAITITALSIAREREMGTFDQLLVSPITPIEILIGKCIPAIVIGIIESSVIIAVGILGFGIVFQGSFALLYFSLIVFITSIVGIGLFISSLAKTQQQASLGTFIFVSPAVLLSGFATPIENMPTWLQPVTYAIPLRYHLVVAKGLFLKDISADIVFSNVWPMAIIAVITLSVSTWFFRSKLE